MEQLQHELAYIRPDQAAERQRETRVFTFSFFLMLFIQSETQPMRCAAEHQYNIKKNLHECLKPVISPIRKLRQEDYYRFKASLDSIEQPIHSETMPHGVRHLSYKPDNLRSAPELTGEGRH